MACTEQDSELGRDWCQRWQVTSLAATLRSRANVHYLGFETDANNLTYHAHAEANAVADFNPANASHENFVRDPKINWADMLVVSFDGHLYFANTQLPFSPDFAPGHGRRQTPYSLLSVPLPNNVTKPLLL